ncbi:MAG: sulfatase-like hydrolase/transferase [Comamonadaceae bacterium]|nr:sulfatase-like hydrolase/transferase [Comamonadaceae bacterium]
MMLKLVWFLMLGLCAALHVQAATDARPNIVVLVADDWGFTDVGAFGGEIATPISTPLARSGVRFSNFHVAASCSPTRSMLLTGVDNHRNGHGNLRETMPGEHLGQPGYLGSLVPNVVTLGTLLQAGGYRTYIAGKWNVGNEPHNLPNRRGFDRSFIMGDTGSDNWEPEKALPAPFRPGQLVRGWQATGDAQRILLVNLLRRQDHRLHPQRRGQRQALLRLRRFPGQPCPGAGAAGLHRQIQRPLRRGLDRVAGSAAQQGRRAGLDPEGHGCGDHGHHGRLGRAERQGQAVPGAAHGGLRRDGRIAGPPSRAPDRLPEIHGRVRQHGVRVPVR